ncbi:hypothetical protein FKP32DRAFT_1673693 [Trametes sanguinea]|nr:hypothetical protein FKP32DRAFT_1673693 [Trametes sanguinea]
MGAEHITPPFYPPFDSTSPNIHLAVLKRRVPHLFSSRPRRRHRSSKLKVMAERSVNTSLNRTLDPASIVPVIAKSLQKAHGRRTQPKRPGAGNNQVDEPRLRVELYEIGLLSRQLLDAPDPNEAWMRRWEDVLEKVAEAFADVTGATGQPESSGTSGSQDDNCVKFREDVDNWIKEELPLLLEVIRDVLGRPEEAALVGSLPTIRRNLEKMSSIFPDVGNVRRQQLDALMKSIVAELERMHVPSQDRSMSIDGTVREDGLRLFGRGVFAFPFRDFEDSADWDTFVSDTTMDVDEPQELFEGWSRRMSHGPRAGPSTSAGPATPRGLRSGNSTIQDEIDGARTMSQTDILHGLNAGLTTGHHGTSYAGEGSTAMELTEPFDGHSNALPIAPADTSRAVSDDGGSRMMSFTQVIPQPSTRLPISDARASTQAEGSMQIAPTIDQGVPNTSATDQVGPSAPAQDVGSVPVTPTTEEPVAPRTPQQGSAPSSPRRSSSGVPSPDSRQAVQSGRRRSSRSSSPGHLPGPAGLSIGSWSRSQLATSTPMAGQQPAIPRKASASSTGSGMYGGGASYQVWDPATQKLELQLTAEKTLRAQEKALMEARIRELEELARRERLDREQAVQYEREEKEKAVQREREEKEKAVQREREEREREREYLQKSLDETKRDERERRESEVEKERKYASMLERFLAEREAALKEREAALKERDLEVKELRERVHALEHRGGDVPSGSR